MDVAALIEQHQDRLTPAERRVAAVVLDQPQLVAFGTVADLAKQASTSGASVIRLSTKLGFDGFSSLQDSVQRDLGRQLRPATARIRQPESGDLLDRAAAPRARQRPDHPRQRRPRLASSWPSSRWPTRPAGCCVLTGEASRGIGMQIVSRPVHAAPGRDPGAAAARCGSTGPWPTCARATPCWCSTCPATTPGWSRPPRPRSNRHATVIALSDSVLSPLARRADLHFVVPAKGNGPFDSYVGALALLDVLVAGVADRLRASGHRVARPHRAGLVRGGRAARRVRPRRRRSARRRRSVVSKLVIHRTSVVASSHT